MLHVNSDLGISLFVWNDCKQGYIQLGDRRQKGRGRERKIIKRKGKEGKERKGKYYRACACAKVGPEHAAQQ